MEKARKALASAKILFEEVLFEDCVSRAYYAVLHAAKSVLILCNVDAHTHDGVRSMFGLHFIKPGKIEKEYAKILVDELESRVMVDYDASIKIEKEEAEKSVNDAEKFVIRMESYFNENT
jgi:hypothetical protein